MDENVVELVSALAWPVTVVVLLLVARQQIKSLFAALVNRVADPRSNVSLTSKGLQVGRVEAVEASVQSLQISQEQIAALVQQGVASAGRPAFDLEGGIPGELKSMATRYLEINEPNYAKRVRMKDNLAIDMGNFVITGRVSRDELAESTNEGLLLALATAAHLLPEPEDVRRLLLASRFVARLHVRFRFVLAFGVLAERQLVNTTSEREKVMETLSVFANNADPSLIHAIERTKSRLQIAWGGDAEGQ